MVNPLDILLEGLLVQPGISVMLRVIKLGRNFRREGLSIVFIVKKLYPRGGLFPIFRQCMASVSYDPDTLMECLTHITCTIPVSLDVSSSKPLSAPCLMELMAGAGAK